MTTNKLLQIDSTGKQVAGVGVPSGTDINGAGRIISIGGVPANLSGGVTNQVVGYDGSSPPGLVPKTIVFPTGAGWFDVANIDMTNSANWPTTGPISDGTYTSSSGLIWTKNGTTDFAPPVPAQCDGTYGVTFTQTSGHVGGNFSYGRNAYESLALSLSDLLGLDVTIEMGVRIWICYSRLSCSSAGDYVAAQIDLDTGYSSSDWVYGVSRGYFDSLTYPTVVQRMMKSQGFVSQYTTGWVYPKYVDLSPANNVCVLEIPSLTKFDSRVYFGAWTAGTWPAFSAISLYASLTSGADAMWEGGSPSDHQYLPPNGNQNPWRVRIGDISSSNPYTGLISSVQAIRVQMRK